jgi:hypothetical protein
MMIIDPVILGDVACTRASVKYVYDRTGTLVQVPANTLAVTYDPSDLSKAPHALVEPATTNYISASEDFDGWWAGYFAKPPLTKGYPAPNGTNTATRLGSFDNGGGGYPAISGLIAYNNTGATLTGKFVCSIWARCVSGALPITFGITDGGTHDYVLTTQWQRLVYVADGSITAGSRIMQILEGVPSNVEWEIWGAQVELNAAGKATSYIPSFAAQYGTTRAADVIAPGAGLVYSNVPITETPYSSGATYAQNAIVYDPATYLKYQSLVAGNVGNALTDTTKWTPLLTMVNRWSMFDQYNNTQTSNAEEIIVVLTPQALAQGIYIGNADASEGRISCYDPTDGLVYQETQNLIISDSGSSFYNWCFKRIRKKSYAVSVTLPPYSSALVTITLKKPGGTPKCGMCVLGPLVDIGLSQYGLSREIKDYSTVNFNFDGTSNVIKRNFAKIMDVDVLVDNYMVDSIIESLEGYRQKPVAWIGAAAYGSACLYGTYTSFKNVIQYPTQSAMSLQIQGTV